jgi:KUP system potassium uptake protein
VIVTIKYIVFLMRADNKGEGGMLSLLALVQSAMGRRTPLLFVTAIAGAALFYADGIITPAISVLSAVEGLELVTPALRPYIVPIALAILVGLFAVQSKGTGSVAAWFGPITLVWFIVMGALGLAHIGDDLDIFRAFNPGYGLSFLFSHGLLGFIVLGSVFLAVTGAEALYADMGHFGRGPIRAAWAIVVFPCLVLNYLGQGAMVLAKPETLRNPFFLLAPEWALLPLVALATAATVIASQAVITGAFSMTQQAVQLGLLPRMEIRYTSETTQGQIYVPRVNKLLLVGVVLLVVLFGTSSRLASAYGIAVTGAMLLDTCLFFGFLLVVWRWKLWTAVLLVAPLLTIELAFFGANALKIFDGGYVPLLLAAVLVTVMATWTKGARILSEKTKRDTLPLASVMRSLAKVQRVPGTAVFLTGEPDMAPPALLHNLKHNKVLHQTNVILTVKVADTPRVPRAERVAAEPVGADFWRVSMTFGYMETPNIPLALSKCRDHGLAFDLMTTSFFLGRRNLKRDPRSGMPYWQDRLFIGLARNAADATEYFRIPAGRVVELGTQVLV